MNRRDEIEQGLTAVRERIDAACSSAGRGTDEITLVVVTKFFPASDVRLLAELGVGEVGENRHQEAVAAYADVVHSVDRPKLVGGLSRGALERGRDLDCLVQVSLDPPGATGRSGCDPADIPTLVGQILETEGLRLRGVMGVAPLGGDAGEAFEKLAETASVVRTQAPEATWISAGMSADLELAVEHGATHLRIGSAVLGPRPVVK